jgi:hypothetical protein
VGRTGIVAAVTQIRHKVYRVIRIHILNVLTNRSYGNPGLRTGHGPERRRMPIEEGGSAALRPKSRRLTRLLCDKIEKVDLGFGIEIIRLAATATEPFATKQTISSLVDEPEADVSGLIDREQRRRPEAWGISGLMP